MKTDASGFPENVRRPGIPNPAAIVTRQVKVMAMKVSKGLEFPVVALLGVGHMPAPGEDEKEAARVFYGAATRVTQRLVITASGNGGFFQRLAPETTTQNGERHQQILDVTVEPSVLGFAVQSTQNSLYP